jgi:hypothetical protein
MLPNSRPGPVASKNQPLVGAAADLTTGDALANQLQDQLKKRQQLLAAAGASAGRSPFGLAAIDLGLTNGS